MNNDKFVKAKVRNTIILIFVLQCLVFYLIINYSYQDRIKHAEKILNNTALSIEGFLEKQVEASKIFKIVLDSNYSISESNYKKIVEETTEGFSDLDNVYYISRNVDFIYPNEGKSLDKAKDVIKELKGQEIEEELIIKGPYKVTETSNYLYTVFSIGDYNTNNSGYIVLAYSSPLKEVMGELEQLKNEGYAYRYTNEQTGKVIDVYNEKYLTDVLTTTVDVRGLKFDLEISKDESTIFWFTNKELMFYAFMFLIMYILIILVIMVNYRMYILNRQLMDSSYIDELTGLSNRRQIIKIINEYISAGSSKWALCFMDMDRFKSVNDNYGHSVGDLLLKEVGKRLTSIVAPKENVSRLGGDEFVWIVKYKNLNDLNVQMNNIIKNLEVPFIIEDNEISFGISVGVSLYKKGMTDMDLLKQSDRAMYDAKKVNKGGYKIYGKE